MNRLLFSAGLALLIHGLFFCVHMDLPESDLSPGHKVAHLNMTLLYPETKKDTPTQSSPPRDEKNSISSKPPKLKPPKQTRPKDSPIPKQNPQPKDPHPPVEHQASYHYSGPDSPESQDEDTAFSNLSQSTLKQAGLPTGPYSANGHQKNTAKEAVPRYRENPPPQYPPIARRRGYQGKVILEVLVSRKGEVKELMLSKSSGHPILDKAAMKSVKHWVFEPGERDGKPAEMWVKVPVRFQLR